MPLKKKLKSKEEGGEKVEKEEEEEEIIEDDENLEEEDDSESSENDNNDDNDDDEEDEEDDDEEDDDEEMEGGEEGGEMLMIDFEAREPSGADLDSIKLMLKQKFADLSGVNLDELSRIVVEQGETFGNVVFQAVDEDDEEPVAATTAAATTSSDESDIYGVLSGVDLNSPRTKTFSIGFLKFLSSKKDADFGEILKSKKVFFVVNERFINMPVKICIPMFQDLLKSLKTAKMEFDYWLFVAKVCHQQSSRGQEHIYVNAEEEVFEEFAEKKVELSDTKVPGSNVRVTLNALLLPTDKIDDALNKVISLSQ